MNATKNLKQEHILIRRIRDIAQRCSERLYCHEDIPFEHLKIISLVIEEFIDTLHHRKEEQVYFPATAAKKDDRFSEEIYKFMVEHEFSRRIATMLSAQLASWKNGTISKEPIARFLKTYALFITDHTKKEDDFFDSIDERNTISNQEHEQILEHFASCVNHAGGKARIDELMKLIEYLEEQDWMK